MRKAVFLATFLTASFLAGCALAPSPAVTVIDGDTLRLGKTTIRIYGIDAPELSQTCTRKNGKIYACGKHARNALTDFASSGRVRCDTIAKDVYGRTVAKCYAGADDLAQSMAATGNAVAIAKEYQPAEQTAQQKNIGLWQGKFTLPAEWRRNNPKP